MMGQVDGDGSEKDVSHDVLNLGRLLYCMTSTEQDHDLTVHNLLARVELSRRMWADLEPHLIANNNDPDGIYATLKMDLEQAFEHVKSQVHQIMSDPSSAHYQNPEASHRDDLVEEIFFFQYGDKEQQQDEEQSFQEEAEEDHECSWSGNEDEDDDEDDDDSQVEHEPYPTTNKNKNTAEELQQRQSEQLEEEISEMAAQLKQNTMHMNQTIRTQTNELLDGMEQVAQDNLDSVTQTAKDVDAHVQKGWSKTIATWTLLFTILGTFIFCFMTLRVAPKRPNACLFFCPKTNIQNTPPSSPQQKILPESDTIVDTVVSCDAKDETCASPYQEEKTLEKEEVESNTPLEHQRRQEQATSPDLEATTCEATDENGSCIADLDKEEVEEEMEPEMEQKEEQNQLTDDDDDSDDDDSDDVPEEEEEEANEELAVNEDNEVDSNDEQEDFGPVDVIAAISGGDIDLLESYLSSNPDFIEWEDENKWRPIHEAIRYEKVAVLELLVENGCDVNVRLGETGGSPLWMVQNYLDTPNDELENILQENDAIYLEPLDEAERMEMKWNKRKEAVNKEEEVKAEAKRMEMKWNRRKEIVKEEEEEKSRVKGVWDIMPKLEDSDDGQEEANEELAINEDDETDQKVEHEDFGREDIMDAIFDGDVNRLELYIASKPDCIEWEDQDGLRPIHEAIRYENVGVVQLLVENGCDVNVRVSETGGSPLWLVRNYLDTPNQELENILRESDAIYLEPISNDNINEQEGANEELPVKEENEMDQNDEHEDFGREDIMDAIFDGDVNRLELYIASKPDCLEWEDQDGLRPIHEAIRYENVGAVQLLVENGCDVNVRVSETGGSPLWLVRNYLDTPNEELEHILRESDAIYLEPISDDSINEQEGANEELEVNEENEMDQNDEHEDFGLDDVMNAIFDGDVNRLELYIASKPDCLEWEDQDGWRPIHEAIRYENVAVTQLLVENGCNVNVRVSGTGGSPLWLVQKFLDTPNQELKNILRENDAIYLEPLFDDDDVVEEEEANEELAVNQENGVNPNDGHEDFRRQDVTDAIFDGDVNQLELYIASKPNCIEWEDQDGWRPIHKAIRYENAAVVQLLVDNGCDLNVRLGETGGSPLWMVQKLLSTPNEELETILRENDVIYLEPISDDSINEQEEANEELAINEDDEIDQKDEHEDFGPNDVMNAISDGDINRLELYIASKPDCIEWEDQEEWRPIHEAIGSENVAVLQLLVDHGCDVNVRVSKTGGSPLWMVQDWLETPNQELENILRENDAIYLEPLFDDDNVVEQEEANEELAVNQDNGVNLKDGREDFRRQDVIDAIFDGDINQLELYFVSKPDCIEWEDENGWRPIHEAIYSENVAVVQLLVDHGCDVDARLSARGGSPLWMVRDWLDVPNKELANILEEKDAIYLEPVIYEKDLEGLDELTAIRMLTYEHHRKLDAAKALKEKYFLSKWKQNVQKAVDGMPIIPEDSIELENDNDEELRDDIIRAVMDGDVDQLTILIESNRTFVDWRDALGWQPLHEAIRYDQVKIVQLLVDFGCDVNSRIGETEESPLWMVQESFEPNAEEIFNILQNNGAISYPPAIGDEDPDEEPLSDEENALDEESQMMNENDLYEDDDDDDDEDDDDDGNDSDLDEEE